MLTLRFFLPLLCCTLFVTGLRADSVEPALAFTGEPVKIRFDAATGERTVDIAEISRQGIIEKHSSTLHFEAGVASWMPTREGLYRVSLGDREVRGLAMDPPPSLNVEALRAMMPRNADTLLGGEPFTVLAMGDSVTHTGDYPTILAMMLRRATGNEHIEVIEKSYPGRSNDASVRLYAKDTAEIQPDLVLIMYGLNDQAANVPLPAFLEQTQWLVERLRQDFDADVMLLDPTPDIGMVRPASDGAFDEPSKIFRMEAYAAARRDLADRLGVPVADTFAALWGAGGESLVATGRALWPLYPVHYSKQFTSIVDTEGKGDTLHPNALGHLAIARAVYDRLNGRGSVPRLRFNAHTQWVDGGVETRIEALNLTDETLTGTLQFYPFATQPHAASVDYDMGAGASADFSFRWPGIEKPEDLLKPELERVFRQPGPYVVVLDQWEDGNFPQGVHAPWNPSVYFPLQRHVATPGVLEVKMQAGEAERFVPVQLPSDEQVGRIPLLEKAEVDGETAWAVGEAVYTRFGAARTMEPTVDGSLEEWSDSSWVPVGRAIQARWTTGPRDFRDEVDDCYLEWSFAGGEEGLYLAFKGTAHTRRDRFDVYFDPRSPDALGTAGPYTWVSGSFHKDGTFQVRAGDSSVEKNGIVAAHVAKDDGAVTGEIFVPYAVLNTDSWPESGDLGLSIVWSHPIAGHPPTYLMWAEDGHPWNTRWYGVVRLNPEGPLPYRVRVK